MPSLEDSQRHFGGAGCNPVGSPVCWHYRVRPDPVDVGRSWLPDVRFRISQLACLRSLSHASSAWIANKLHGGGQILAPA
ncbi:hypothetical protein C8R47DRAFT_1225472 [Mycena vitilis]|nr:hypothetical protein C8R47DRAFT_1225472 [Mycena vitilis]